MLDEKSVKVLEYIRSVSKDGAFKVMDADEIIESAGGALTKAELSKVIKDLAEREYIYVKFATLNDYCLAGTSKAIIEAEKTAVVAQKIIEETGVVAAPGIKTASGISVKRQLFLAALLGGFIGGFFASIVYLIISLAVK
ncbi:MAG TPA: hypothetical protein P5161_05610 [Eubacteriales bacterium]|nr:hypothetical protein [Clostridia bacterium]HRR90234.1 hypothetical protein [Eubacteriales bacterium]HRU84296.1 hypothetical protein [Eubacteriales bacterium]